MNTVQIFQYNNNDISFQTGGESVMINATNMAKSFGKSTKDWLRTSSAKEFIDTLSAVRQICLTDLIKVVQGGNQQGTWMSEDVALEFARWLSPVFGIWCNDRIKELMRFGITATPEMLAKAAADPMFVLRLLEEIREGYEKGIVLAEQNALLQQQVAELEPKGAFYDHIKELQQEGLNKKTYLVSRIAGMLGMRPAELNRALQKKGVQVKCCGQWMLTHKYQNMGYTETRTAERGFDEDGDPIVAEYMVWTRKGCEFILSLFEK